VEDTEVKNAVIKNMSLNTDNHGLLSAWIDLDYGVTCQHFGGYALYLPDNRIDSFAGYWIFRVLEIAGVSEWKDLPGKAIRVKATSGRVIEIGHIIKDDWFNPEKDFAPYI
jgi:hypothetical protein